MNDFRGCNQPPVRAPLPPRLGARRPSARVRSLGPAGPALAGVGRRGHRRARRARGLRPPCGERSGSAASRSRTERRPTPCRHSAPDRLASATSAHPPPEPLDKSGDSGRPIGRNRWGDPSRASVQQAGRVRGYRRPTVASAHSPYPGSDGQLGWKRSGGFADLRLSGALASYLGFPISSLLIALGALPSSRVHSESRCVALSVDDGATSASARSPSPTARRRGAARAGIGPS
jgi:hypothetical protein